MTVKWTSCSIDHWAINFGCVEQSFPLNVFFWNFNTVIFSPNIIFLAGMRGWFCCRSNTKLVGIAIYIMTSSHHKHCITVGWTFLYCDHLTLFEPYIQLKLKVVFERDVLRLEKSWYWHTQPQTPGMRGWEYWLSTAVSWARDDNIPLVQ